MKLMVVVDSLFRIIFYYHSSETLCFFQLYIFNIPPYIIELKERCFNIDILHVYNSSCYAAS